MTCAIIDDEPLAAKLIESYVLKTPGIELKGSYSSAIDAVSELSTTPVDILFLDIQMPEVDGLSFARMIQNGKTAVVFTTAFAQYAIDGFKVNALDYLLKPITYEDFMGAIAKYRHYAEHEANITIPGVLPEGHADSAIVDGSVFVKSDYKLVRINLADILYIEGLKDYVKIYRKNEHRAILSLTSMRSLEEQLPDNFMRVHRSYIVNLNQIEVIERGQIVFGEQHIPVSDTFKDEMMDYIQKHLLPTR